MRECEVQLGGETVTLAATFAAATKIADKVADPLAIAREAALEASMLGRGLPYEPRFKFSVQNVPMILHIGMTAAGSKATLAEVQEMVFDAGFIVARDAATEYIATLVMPRSEETTEGKASGE
jgi:hypothetical protein